ncbi:unnamed protein product [Leptidea sinapis]|uniref:Cytochrome P450 n=1 Tax=Leptidea sinapis TaxID=189913 RepID=A0A5E4R1K7_9NEOP|nr:unnamed protein product [Leptidea sinapis]
MEYWVRHQLYFSLTQKLQAIRPGFHTLAHFRKMIKYKDTPHLPTGLLTDEGELWKSFRSTVNPILLQPKTIKLYTNILNEMEIKTQ